MIGDYVHWRTGENTFSKSTCQVQDIITTFSHIDHKFTLYDTIVGEFRRKDLIHSDLHFEDVAIRDVKKVIITPPKKPITNRFNIWKRENPKDGFMKQMAKQECLKFVVSLCEAPGYVCELDLITFERLINKVRR